MHPVKGAFLISFLVDELAFTGCAVVIESVEIFGDDFVVESVSQDISVAGLKKFIGTVMQFKEGIVVFGSGDRVQPGFLLFVKAVFPFEMVGIRHGDAGDAFGEDFSLPLPVMIHEADDGGHIHHAVGIHMLGKRFIAEHLGKHGNEFLVDDVEEVFVFGQGIAWILQEEIHFVFLGEADIDVAFKVCMEIMILSRDSSVFAETGLVENIRMGFSVQKIMGELSEDERLEAGTVFVIFHSIGTVDEELEELLPIGLMELVADFLVCSQ